MGGLARSVVIPPAPTLSGREDPASLKADVAALAEYATRVTLALHDLYDTLSRRSNEMLQSGTLADRPAAGPGDRIYLATDQAAGSRLTYDAGTSSGWLAP